MRRKSLEELHELLGEVLDRERSAMRGECRMKDRAAKLKKFERRLKERIQRAREARERQVMNEWARSMIAALREQGTPCDEIARRLTEGGYRITVEAVKMRLWRNKKWMVSSDGKL